jgi:hypothetical protein
MKDYINNNFGMQIPINPPKLDTDLSVITQKIMVESVENVDDLLLSEIIKTAKEKDATFLFILNKEYIYNALDKQRAKKVKQYKDFVTIKQCPVCDHELIYGSKYCDQCGQKLDWEE